MWEILLTLFLYFRFKLLLSNEIITAREGWRWTNWWRLLGDIPLAILGNRRITWNWVGFQKKSSAKKAESAEIFSRITVLEAAYPEVDVVKGRYTRSRECQRKNDSSLQEVIERIESIELGIPDRIHHNLGERYVEKENVSRKRKRRGGKVPKVAPTIYLKNWVPDKKLICILWKYFIIILWIIIVNKIIQLKLHVSFDLQTFQRCESVATSSFSIQWH